MKVFIVFSLLCISNVLGIATSARSLCVNGLDESLYECINPLKIAAVELIDSEIDYCFETKKSVRQCNRIVKRTITEIIDNGEKCFCQFENASQKKLRKINTALKAEINEAIKATDERCIPGGYPTEDSIECLKEETAINADFAILLVELEAHKLRLMS